MIRERDAEDLHIPVDVFKWVFSIFLALLIFIGSSYEKAYFRIFGVSDFATDRDLSQFAVNAFDLLFRPILLFALVAVWLGTVFTCRAVARPLQPAIIGLAIAISFAAAGYRSQAEAKKDATQLIYGVIGRKVWCKAKPDAWDADQRAAFEQESKTGNFRLLLESKGYLILTNVRTKSKEEKNAIQGQALMVKRDDLTFCRVSGMSL